MIRTLPQWLILAAAVGMLATSAQHRGRYPQAIGEFDPTPRRSTTTASLPATPLTPSSAPLAPPPAQPGQIDFSFALNAAATTSAGVFRTDGTLVRTMWKGVHYAAGSYTANWDGKDDGGNPLPQASYEIRLLTHNVEYVWDGAIGNTSAEQSGPTVHHAFRFMRDIAFTDSSAFYVAGYNEAQYGMHRFELTDTQRLSAQWTWLYNAQFDRVESSVANIYDRDWHFAATDGTWVYFGATSSYDQATNQNGAKPGFIVASRASDNAVAAFTLGQRIPAGPTSEKPYPNGVFVGATPGLSGMAVQGNGALLAAAVASENKVYLLDKRSGAVVRSLDANAPRRLEFAPNGDLWVVTVDGVSRYTHLEASPTLAVTLSGLSKPLDVAASPLEDLVLVADGGASQQVKAYASNGTPLWTFGRAGGYGANGPDVGNDKFFFFNGEDDNINEDAFVSFARDGSFWLGDIGDSRVLHLRASDRGMIEQIAFVPHSYLATVDPNRPARVFNRFLEYRVDYAKPLAGTNGSWTLVRNWEPGLGDQYRRGSGSGFQHVITLANGRTYAQIGNGLTKNYDLVELTATGLRQTGIKLRNTGDGGGRNQWLADNGDLRTVWVGLTAKWENQALGGFDATGNPQWTAASILAAVQNVQASDPAPRCCGSGAIRPAVTASGVVVSYDQSLNNGYHLGGVKPGGSGWLWKAMPAVQTAPPFFENAKGDYVIGEGVNYGGNVVVSAGRNVIAGYHGEGWNQAQANQFMHYYDDGLFVGQFGVPGRIRNGPGYFPIRGEVTAGFAGNSFSPQVATVGSQLYLWINDEGGHGPQRWSLKGIDGIRELTSIAELGTSIVLKRRIAINCVLFAP